MSYLTVLLLMPLFGAALIAVVPSRWSSSIRQIAVFTSVVSLVWSFLIYIKFDQNVSSFQFIQKIPWNERLGTSFSVGIDGIALAMVILSTLLVFVAIVASKAINHHVKGYYFFMLLLEAAVVGVFISRDWSLFYVFWELTLIPLFILISRWGSKNASAASLNFVLYTIGGSVFMLISLLVLFDASQGHSFSMAVMSEGAKNLALTTQIALFVGLLIGFGVKMPIFPLHGWLPLAHVEAPAPVSILLSGILLKMGAYGLIRTVMMLPDAALYFQNMLMGLALFALIYGGLLAWRQTDLKRMIAYSSVSHMGVVLLGIATLNQAGITGAMMQMISHGLVAGSLFLLIGLLYQRTNTRDINDYGSLIQITPRFAFFIIFAFMAAIGIPGTSGFVAELHVLIGGFEQWQWWVIWLSIGVVISAAYGFRTVGKLFTGPTTPKMREVTDLQGSEMIAASLLAFLILFLGLYPAPALDLIEQSVNSFTVVFSGGVK